MAAMWTFALARLAGILLIGLCAGLLIGPIWALVLAVACLYLGWQMAPEVALGVEAFEAYAIDLPNVRDGNRETLVVSPSVRLALPWVQPAISAFTNLGPPLSSPWVQRQTSTFTVPGDTGTVWGFRFTFTLVYDPTSSLRLKGR